MKKQLLGLFSFAAFAATAATTVSNVSLVQDAATGIVTIGYTLSGDPAIVTLDIEKDGVSIGGAAVSSAVGDVNDFEQPGDKTIYWYPTRTWCDQSAAALKPVITAWTKAVPPDYLAIDLTRTNTFRHYAGAEFVPGGVTNDLYKTKALLMRRIPAKDVVWTIGPNAETLDSSYDKYRHAFLVCLTNDYYIGVFELTQGQLATINTGYTATDPNFPPQMTSWNAVNGYAGLFANGAGRKTFRGIPGFRMPTNAEWEFAARAGSPYSYFWGNGRTSADYSPYAWFGTFDVAYHEVGLLKPNGFGLYDIMGNAAEWVSDWNENKATTVARLEAAYPGYVDSVNVITNPVGPATGSNKCLRGGPTANPWESLAFGNDYTPGSAKGGVRLVLPVSRLP